MGTITRQKIQKCEAPSTLAASSSSSGMLRKNWRIRNTPNALNAQGTIRAWYELIQSRSLIRKNMGTTSTCWGTTKRGYVHEEQLVPAPEMQAGKAVAGQQRGRHRQGRPGDADNEAVQQESPKWPIIPGRHEVRELGGMGEARQAVVEGVRLGLQCRPDPPRHRQQQQERRPRPGPCWRPAASGAGRALVREASRGRS